MNVMFRFILFKHMEHTELTGLLLLKAIQRGFLAL